LRIEAQRGDHGMGLLGDRSIEKILIGRREEKE